VPGLGGSSLLVLRAKNGEGGSGEAWEARTQAEGLGPGTAGSHPCGPGGIAFPGGRASEGLGAAQSRGWDPRFEETGVEDHAGKRPAFPASGPPGAGPSARGHDHHASAQHHVGDGWGWIFPAVEHWNSECVGWHVCKEGTRYAALEPIAMGLTRIYGSVEPDVARGLALRMDNGTQYIADHFLHQLRFWGITPSFAFVEQPQTNGVAERFNRTLKEQVIHGRIFRNLAEVREAVAAFVERYNAEWRVEKLGFLTPLEARDSFGRQEAA